MHKANGVAAYLLLAFGIAWALWEVPLQLGLSTRNPWFQLAAVPGAFAPAVAAIIVRRWITREGFDDAGLRLNLGKWPYYLIAWLLPFAVVAVIAVLAPLLGIGHADFSLRRGLSTLAPPGTNVSPPPYIWLALPVQLLFIALIATPILWGEEFGWRGYLQMRLFRGRPLLAAVITGLIWGVWHYPVNLRGYNFPDNPILGLFVFPIGTALVSIIFGWLHLRTGSVWSCSLGHAAMNAIGGSLIVLLFAGGPGLIYVNYLGLLGWVPLGLFAAWIVLSGQFNRGEAKAA